MHQRFTAFVIVALFWGSVVVLLAQQGPEDPAREKFRSMLPSLLLGNTNAGTEFYFSFPPCYEVPMSGNSVRLYISSGVRTLVTVEVEGTGYFQQKYTIPNDIIDFEIPPALGQPYQKNPRDPAPPDQIYRGAAVHVTAEDPIIVYGVTRFRWTSDGFLAIPVSALGREYRIASYADMSAMYPGYELPSETTITAAFDGTTVVFEVGGNIMTRTASGWKPGDRKVFNLQAGDVLVVSTKTKEGDLSGSRVIATKPIAVVSGNQCANIPTYIRWCDYISEMELPVHTWGTVYHVTRIAGRQKNSYIKVFAKEPNTTVYINGQPVGLIRKAWGMEGEAFLHQRVSEEDPGAFLVHADKPIYVVQYNTGQEDDNVPSDPFQLVLTPLEQFQTEIVFNTPGVRGTNRGFTRNYVNLVYQLDSGDVIPDDLEFAVVNNGQFQWRKVKELFGPFPGDIFPFEINGKKFAAKTLELPGDGVYRIRCSKPFAAYAYGFSDYDSYGFPTSVALADLTVPDTVAPNPTFTINCDTSEISGEVEDLPDNPAVRSNLAKIVLDPFQSYNYTLTYKQFTPGESFKTSWSLKVDTLEKPARAVVIFTDRAGNDTTIEFHYRPYLVALHPPQLDFGVLKKGEQKTLTGWLVNLSQESPVTITRLELQQGSQGFEFVTNVPLPVTLQPGDSIPVEIRFTASAPGKYEDSVGHGNECVFGYDQLLEAVVNAPRIEVSDADFGKVVVNDVARRDVTIYNNSDAPVVIYGYTGPNNPVFTALLSPDDFPMTLGPKQRYTFQVEFSPTATRTYSDQIIFSNDAQEIDSIAVLVGEGIEPGLLVQNYDWGRKRVFTGPYAGEIVLENTGTADVLITQITPVAGGDIDQFNLPDFAQLVPLQLKPGETRTIAVEFAPTAEGPQEVVVEFTYNKAGQPATEVSRLTGIGIVPRLTTEDVDFGQMYLGNPRVQRQMEIRAPAGEYNDSVVVTGFNLQALQAEPNEFTYNPVFRRNGVPVTLPFTLQPGDVVTLDECFFEAQQPGIRTAQVEVITLYPVYDDNLQETPVISNWRGEGIAAGEISVGQPNEPRICETDTAHILIPVENTGNAPFDITDAQVTGGDVTDFYVPASQQFPVTVPAHGSVTLTVVFDPQQTGTRQATLTIFNTTLDNPEATVDVQGTAELFSSELTIQSNKQRPIPSEHFTVTVGLSTPIDALAQVDQVTIELQYDGTLFEPLVDQINAVRAGTTIENIQRDVGKSGRLRFDIRFTSAGQIDAGDLATIQFQTLLSGATKSPMSATAVAVGNECVDITPASYTQEIGEVCILNLRTVRLAPGSYALLPPQPNPMERTARIDFSIPFEDHVWIGLYNSEGELVQVLVDQKLQPGQYQIQLQRELLPAGTYFCRMKSGRYTQTQRLIVQ